MVKNLEEIPVKNVYEAIQLFQKGMNERRVASTNYNERSRYTIIFFYFIFFFLIICYMFFIYLFIYFFIYIFYFYYISYYFKCIYVNFNIIVVHIVYIQ